MTTICICGAGTMGSGIAQVSAIAGFKTILYDVRDEIIQKAKSKIENDLHILLEKKKISEQKKEDILQQIFFSPKMRWLFRESIHNNLPVSFLQAAMIRNNVAARYLAFIKFGLFAG